MTTLAAALAIYEILSAGAGTPVCVVGYSAAMAACAENFADLSNQHWANCEACLVYNGYANRLVRRPKPHVAYTVVVE